MPPVKPTMRGKRRYIMFEIVCEGALNGVQVKRAAYDSILTFLGEYGSSLASPKFIGFDLKRKLAVIKCAHSELANVEAALALVRSVEGKKAAFHLKKVSGTIAGLSR